MSNKELKRCPFCGGEAKYDNSDGYHYVICDECGARNFGFSKEHAFDEWNKRVQFVDDESNYPEKQDSSNYSEFPKSSIGEKIIDAIIENKLFSVINPRTNKEIEESLVVWAGNANEIIETVVCEKSCKEENATLKPLIPKWSKYSDKTLILNINIIQNAYIEFDITNEENKYRLTAFLKTNDRYYNKEDGGIFSTIEEAKEKANDYIKWIGERLVCFAENIRIDE